MNYVDKVITIALNEVGYLEKKSNKNLDSKTANAGSANYTKYGRDMHDLYPSIMDFPAAWCDCFVDWCFYKAYGVTNAKGLLGGDFNDYTVASANLYKNKKAWYTSNPKIGDQIFFKNSNGICHTGLVYNVDKKYVYTVEGNTSSGSTVVSNGGEVCKKKYLLTNSKIAGYGRPKYDTEKTEGWVQDDIGWWYQYKDGSCPKSCWKTIDKKDYYFDKDGYVLTDQFIKSQDYKINKKLYYVDEKGAWDNKTYRWMQDDKGWWITEIGAKWYPKDKWEKIDSIWYYFKSDGYMAHDEWIGDWYVGADGAYDSSKKKTTSAYKVKVTANALNVRVKPDKKSSVKRVITKHEIYTVTKTSGEWSYLESIPGWSMTKFLQKI